MTFLFHYLKYFKIIPLFQLQENNTTQAYSKKVISKKKKKFLLQIHLHFLKRISKLQLVSSSNDRTRNCVTEIITSHDLSPSSSPTKAVEKLWNRYAGARGNRMEERRKKNTSTGAVHRMAHGTKVKETGATATQRAKEQEETGGSSG